MMLLKKMLVLKGLFILAVMGVSSVSGAQQDHPLISHYPDFKIKHYHAAEYDEAAIIVGAFDLQTRSAPTMLLEGKVTNIVYEPANYPSSVTDLQLYKNYEAALKKLNAELLFHCRGESCLINKPKNSFEDNSQIGFWIREQAALLKGVGGDVVIYGNNSAILTAKVAQGDQVIHIMITLYATYDTNRRIVSLSIVESDKLDTDKIAISSPDELRSAIDQAGRVVLDGIYFDHDKASVKAESNTTLKAMADYLQSVPKATFFVVGHTDNTGDYHYNMTLSQDRAKAVIITLTKQYQVPLKQLQAVGIGPVAPAVNNNSDTSRANNRRVELVKSN